MLFSPFKDILGFKYFKYNTSNKQGFVFNVTGGAEDEYFNFDGAKINIDCGYANVKIERYFNIDNFAFRFEAKTRMTNALAGIDRLNAALQECFNPHDSSLNEWKSGHRIFRENDKILQLKNQVDDGVYNGDIGLLVEVIPASEDFNSQSRLIVDFDGVFAEYTSENLSNITHAYCISVHKSQGSEYPIVILPIVNEATFMLQRRLIYTAVSRAKKSLVLLGNKELFVKAVLKEEKQLRHTTLKQRMLKMNNERIFPL
jgi:ATP-dependent exoDNAse (exonuclease V) alpha subunit